MICVLALLLALPVAAQDAGSTANATFGTLEHDGLTRSYVLSVPAGYDADTASPLMVVLHQYASSGYGAQAMTALDDTAEDMLVVYPNTVGMRWQDGRAYNEQIDGPQADDVGYIAALLDHLAESYTIDSERVYLVGALDSGGTMAFRLACNIPERFAGVAVVGAFLWHYHIENCPSPDPLNMLILSGSLDPHYPIGGREFPNQREGGGDAYISSAQGTINFWAGAYNCVTETAIISDRLVQVPDCDDGVTITTALMNGINHSWPRSGERAINDHGLDASQMIVDFFNNQPNWGSALEDFVTADDALDRAYRYYVPTGYDPETPVPVVFVLHGRPSNSVGMAAITGMNFVAEAENFIAVYPDGIDQGWNYVLGSPYFALQSEQDDSQFFEDLIDEIALDLNIDRSRVYVTGFSNGGFMTHRLACDSQDIFAAFAPAGSGLFAGLPEICDEEESGPIPILLEHGTADVSIAWQGNQDVSPLGDTVFIATPFPLTVAFWLDRNGCPREHDYTALAASGPTQVYVSEYANCEGAPVTVYAIRDGGHNWPGRPDLIGEEIAGLVNTDINMSQVVWDFFEQFSLED